MDKPTAPHLTPRAEAALQDRLERQAQALRDNLRRRKQQSRAQAANGPPPGAAPETRSEASSAPPPAIADQNPTG